MSVFPSYFNVDQPATAGDVVYGNVSLKEGQIININFPDPSKDKESFITYDVFIADQQGTEVYNNIAYDCIPAQMFGSAADFLEYSYRSNVTKNSKKKQEDLLTEAGNIDVSNNDSVEKLLGAHVLVAFIGGDSSRGVILSALPNFFLSKNKEYVFQNEKAGKFLNFAFNGIKININDDGELLLAVNGPTTSEGKLDSEKTKSSNVGSFVKINKDGEIILSTTTKIEKEDGFIKNPDISNADNKITIKKDGSIEIKIDGGTNLKLNKKDNDAELTLGNGGKHVAVAEELKQLYDSLKNYIDNHMHQAGAFVAPPSGGPVSGISGGPIASSPSWSDAIVSKTMKIPK